MLIYGPVLYCVHSRLLRNPSHTARCSTGVRASLFLPLLCHARPPYLPIIHYHILSWFIHGSFMFKDTEGQHEPIKAINGLDRPGTCFSLASEESQSGHGSGLLLCDTAPKATSVAMACKPSPGEFITSSTQKVEIYWRTLSHCLKLNMGLLKIIEHQWCDFPNPMICYTVEYTSVTLVTLVLEFGSLAPMFEPFSKGYPCTRFFQGMKEQMRLVSQMLRDINMVEGARFTLHQTRLILQIWLVDTCGCNATEARFPMETSFQLLVLAVCSAWAT